MTLFTKYPSIENAYKQKFLDRAMFTVPTTEMWAVCEKIHGANFSFIVTNDGIMCARRGDILKKDEKFYNYRPVLDKYNARLKALFEDIKIEYNCESIQVIGELYGNGVQTGVYYSDDQDFTMFDILVNGEYLDYDLVSQLGIFHGILPPPLLGFFTLEKALQLSNKFPSKMPARHGKDSPEDNICEGTVIRPNKTYWLGEGFESSRVILKNKNEKFSEKTVKEVSPVKSELAQMVDNIMLLVNDNRIDSAASKLGEVEMSRFGEFMREIIEDVQKDSPEAYFSLDNADRKVVDKKVNQLIAKELRLYMKNKGL